MTTVAAPVIEPHKIELVLRQLDGLPPLPSIVIDLLSWTGESVGGGAHLVGLIERDASLSARLLALARSPVHAKGPEPSAISEAVARMGVDAVREAALCVKVMEVFSPAPGLQVDGGLDRTEFWKHCIGVACAAGRIASQLTSTLRPSEAFGCGLLHDLGVVALDQVMPKSLARIIQQSRDGSEDAHDVAQSLLGVDHSVAGRRLATRWDLPQSLIECIWLHDQDPDGLPAPVAAGRHVQIVQLASALVRRRRIGYWLPRAERSARELAGRLGVDSQPLMEIGDWVQGEVETRAQMLGLDDRGRQRGRSRMVAHGIDSLTPADSTLIERNRLLTRKAEYFNGLSFLNRSISPADSVIDACGAAAEALRQAMSVNAVMVFAIGAGRSWHEVGISDGSIRTEFVKPPSRDSELLSEARFAADLAQTGTWLSPPGPHVSGFVQRFRHSLGAGPTWLMPLVQRGRCAGGAVLQADTQRVAAWHGESAEMEGLSSACGLAIAQARSASSSVGSGEALADVNRRQAAVHAETWRAKALETVAQMAAGAAHEMNTALAVISGRAQLLRGQAADADEKAADAIVEQADICSNVLTDLMEFAAPRSPRPETIDLLELVESLVARLAFEGISEASEITIAIPSDTPRARFDREQLIGTFRELIANAVSVTEPATRRLTIKAERELTDKNVVVAVIDNGRGMPAEIVDRALDPFFSHRPAGRGRGLGLARVQQVMRLNGGRVRIDSTPGRGTRVELRLPCGTRGDSERSEG